MAFCRVVVSRERGSWCQWVGLVSFLGNTGWQYTWMLTNSHPSPHLLSCREQRDNSSVPTPNTDSSHTGSRIMSSLMSYGTTKTFQIPIDHLDYKFIETCTDVKHLEKILSILRSGEEGSYPDLTEFCEKRIESLAPKSRALQKDKPAATPASFTSEEWKEIEEDVESWVTEIKLKENKVPFQKTENVFQERVENVPPVRSATRCASTVKNNNSENRLDKKNRTPRDYRDWEKFDVEKECSKIEETREEKSSKTVINSKMLKIEKRIDISGASEIEIGYLANHEKEKGNEAFRTGDFEEAVTYYTRSISVQPSIVAYNNRAQAEIKRQNWQNALNDCEKVLDLEPGNIKALLRRATVNKHLGNCQRAVEDLNKVLCDEPGNATAKKLLSEIEENMKGSENTTHGKGKRILIQEIEGSDEGEEDEDNRESDQADQKTGVPVGGEIPHEKIEMGNAQKKFTGREDCCKPEDTQPCKQRDESEGGARKDPASKGNAKAASDNKGSEAKRHPHKESQMERNARGGVEQKSGFSGTESSPAVNGTATLLPPTAATLKNQGNELFKNGQFGAAVAKYSEAIENLKSLGVDIPEDLSILYSNRAACYLKDGNCSDCIEDCNRSLELQPFSIKPLLRRAMAYESVERYRQAYVDYKTVLQIDSGIQSANDSINRITRTLMDQDGPTWREKLPPIPAVPVSAESHRWGGISNSSSEDKQSPQISSKKAEEMFLSFKQEGNAFVKKAQYKQALEKYNSCVKLNSEECSIYTNRALCYLKLCQFDEARQDCDSALQLDASNLKAFYRRALAYKGLQNYQASVDDLNKVLQIDGNVTEARKELEEVTQFLESTTNGKVTNHEKQRKKIQIQEVNENHEEEEEVKLSKDFEYSVTTGDENKRPLATSTKLTISKPSNAYDFGQLMNAIMAEQDRAACADLLTNVEPKDLPIFLSNKLECDSFLIIIRSLKSYLLEKEPKLVYQHLFHLSKAERFQMILLLLSKKEKDEVRALFNALSGRQCEQIVLEDVRSLSRNYGL